MKFLHRIEAMVSTMHVEATVKKFLDKFFKADNLPLPKIKIVNDLNARWLGRTTYNPHEDENNTTIEIQKKVVGDQDTLERIVAHELIHHWEFLVFYKNSLEREMSKIGLKRLRRFKPAAHGKEFYEMAEKINAVMGKDYVTEKSDESYVKELDKEYYLLIVPAKLYGGGGKFGWAWAARPSTEQKAVIQEKIAEDKAKLVKTKDERFLRGTKIKKFGGISIPRDEETQTKLREVYEQGKEVTL
jgi:hypothetical protein